MSQFLGGPLTERASLADLAFERIKAAILSGQLKPGETIREPAFAEALNISRTSLREALFRLEAQGYAERGASNRWRIFSLSEESARDIYACRGALEGLAAKLAAENVDQTRVAALRAELDNAWRADEAGGIDRVIESTTRFQLLILEYSGNRKLAFLMEILRPQLLLNRRMMLDHTPERRAILEGNEHLLEAIAAGDGEWAHAIAVANAEKDLDAVLKLIEEGVLTTS